MIYRKGLSVKLRRIIFATILTPMLLNAMENDFEQLKIAEISQDAWILAWPDEIKENDDPGYVDPKRAQKIQKALNVIKAQQEQLKEITIPIELKIILKFTNEDVTNHLPDQIAEFIKKYDGKQVYNYGKKVQHYRFEPSINIIGLVRHINNEHDVAELNPIWGELKTAISLEEEKDNAVWKFEFIENIGKEVTLINQKNEKIKSNQVLTKKRITHTVYYHTIDDSIQSTSKNEQNIN